MDHLAASVQRSRLHNLREGIVAISKRGLGVPLSAMIVCFTVLSLVLHVRKIRQHPQRTHAGNRLMHWLNKPTSRASLRS